MTKRYSNIYAVVALLLAFILSPAVACAFKLDTYAASSRLSSGKWVRVSVAATGMHCISESMLRSWGFSDPSKVRVYGYGAKRLPDQLTTAYIDDLPQTASEYVQGKGVFFYALGPVAWTNVSGNLYRPSQNPYTSVGYYYLTDDGAPDDAERLVPPQRAFTQVSDESSNLRVNTFYDRLFHEKDLESPGEAGFFMVGEDFRYQTKQTFDFTLTDLAEPLKELQDDGSAKEIPTVNIEFSFVALTISGASQLTYTANGTTLTEAAVDRIEGVSGDSHYTHGRQSLSRKDYMARSEKLSLGVNYRSSGTVSRSNLNYIAIAYLRKLQLPASRNLDIYLSSRSDARLANAGADTRVWDVSDPTDIRAMETKMINDSLQWGATSTRRTYAAWEPAGKFPSPVFVEQVRNQNLHALPVPDMVIFTPGEWKSEAERLAAYHRDDKEDPLQLLVLTPQEVYNEFSSGVPDAQSFRKCMKMFYDRCNSSEAVEGEGRLRYALFMSRPTYDYRRVSPKVANLKYPMLPTWFTDNGLSDNDSYMTDDMMAFLEDNSGANLGRDRLCVAVGRLPVTSVANAKAAVDKIIAYKERSPKGLWQNNIVMLADDRNSGIHMIQADSMWVRMNQETRLTPGAGAIYKKVYIDEYEQVSGTYPEARTQLYRNLDEGAMLWAYIGHANPSSLTAEGIVTYTDLNNFYLRHWPLVYAATCDFMRWDSTDISGAEILFSNPSGGVVSAISATRPVYIADNGYLTKSLGIQFFKRDENGRVRTVGEIYQAMKNEIWLATTSLSRYDTNKLRYVLLGDPAMRLVYPSNIVRLNEVAGKPVVPVDGDEEPVQLMARQTAVLRGNVTDPSGNVLTDFDGTLTVTLYDADYSVTTHGYGIEDDPGIEYTTDKMGGRLYVGSANVTGGAFEMTVSMPAEVADNYREATFNMYAQAKDGREANGVCRDLYVYGIDADAIPDETAPVIESMYLNHPSFRDGQAVNSAPMLIATVTDDRALNLSTAGVGHNMALYLDGGDRSYTDISDFFVPFADGTPGGTINYPLSNLAPGYHSLRLRVWDTGPNSAEATVNFSVQQEVPPVIYDVYTDCNPASERANFYISHDRPDLTMTVTVEVFDLMGRPIWQKTQTARSDMFTTMPITWDLLDSGGRRVQRGIYLYRATVSDSDSGEKTATASRRLAVTAQ